MLNKCTFVGRLAGDPDLRYTPNGKAVANFQLALTDPIPDSNGNRNATFIRCVVWNKVAESMADNLSKGDMVAFESRVQVRSFEREGSQKREYITEFVVEGFPQFLKVKKWENGAGSTNSNQNQRKNQQGTDPFENHGQPIDINDDDLPF